MEKNKFMLITIMALLALLLGAIGFFGFSLMKFIKTGAQEQQTQRAEGVLSVEEVQLVDLSKALNTNLRADGDDSGHIASVNISIGVDNTSKKSSVMLEMLQEKESIVRDICLDILRDSAYGELTQPDGKNEFRQAILARLRSEFDTDLIYQIYIKDWYLE